MQQPCQPPEAPTGGKNSRVFFRCSLRQIVVLEHRGWIGKVPESGSSPSFGRPEIEQAVLKQVLTKGKQEVLQK
jgi:hypothetical protein